MSIRIAVLSDLHCHPSTAGGGDSLLHCDGNRVPADRHPLESLLALISREKLSASAVLTPGDLTNKSNRQGFVSAWPFVKEVASAMRAKLIAGTLGNHDVDSRKTLSQDPFQIPKEAHSDFPVPIAAEREKFWAKGFCSISNKTLRILIVNSVINHTTEAEARRGGVTDAQLNGIDQELKALPHCKFQVALFHHHPIAHEDLNLGTDDLMQNGARLLELLEEHKFHLAVHGHKHHPRLRYGPGGATATSVFAAGSFAARITGEIATNTRNLFHIIELESKKVKGCMNHGKIHSWEFNMTRGWNVPNVQSSSFPNITGFGWRTEPTELADQITAWFRRSRQKFKKWEELRLAFPQVDYLVPSDARALAKQLASKSQLECNPQLPDRPAIIGLPVTRRAQI